MDIIASASLALLALYVEGVGLYSAGETGTHARSGQDVCCCCVLLPTAEDQLMRVLRFTQAQPPPAAAPATAATATAAAADGSTGKEAPPAAAAGPLQGLGSRLSALNPVPAVLGLLSQTMVRESAQEQLRRELQGEGAWGGSCLNSCATVGSLVSRDCLIRSRL
jgi:hypothetical protein